jgi:hypothetical protein
MEKLAVFRILLEIVTKKPVLFFLLSALLTVGLIIYTASFFIGSQNLFAMYLILAIASLIVISFILVVFMRVSNYSCLSKADSKTS